ncbi:hypothetical protein J437_LFUL013050 [Ladona fulva]|uniref:CB1 cannabinoid receptor-interacting protein 1 n=1 Tax=Ladona fulva TaxID=123851 RepID=A0A8K0KG74_LADFU|nr:hypothetical protein J437_LFUL013050 [Ladona fulva]
MDGGRRKSTASVGNTSPKGSTFKVTLSIRREPGGSPVYCKMDGRGKFKQSKTVKLAADSIYRVDVSFKPPRFLSGDEIVVSDRAPRCGLRK